MLTYRKIRRLVRTDARAVPHKDAAFCFGLPDLIRLLFAFDFTSYISLNYDFCARS
jgi:hypothetical protein